jgi:S1-C subfamily serine protease
MSEKNTSNVSGPSLPPSTHSPTPAYLDDLELLDAYSRSVIAVVDLIGPAVVSVMVGGEGPRRAIDRQAAGSGVVITPDGYIITNDHVVSAGKELKVSFADGNIAAAVLIGRDSATDLAVIRAPLAGLPFASFDPSTRLHPGQVAIAIGNPFGFQSTVSTGVISATGRALMSRAGRLIEDIIQHTAPLNPGNSGGPLADTRGQVIGINTAIIPSAQGIGFAVPASAADWVVPQILANGRVQRGYLGIAAQSRPLERRLARLHNLEQFVGVEILSVEAGGAAAQSGLRAGDLLVRYDEQAIDSVAVLHRLLAHWRPPHHVQLGYIRGHSLQQTLVQPDLR